MSLKQLRPVAICAVYGQFVLVILMFPPYLDFFGIKLGSGLSKLLLADDSVPVLTIAYFGVIFTIFPCLLL